ncbi:MAG: LysM peptidoglycan-binding domain-containing protein [Desulforegulaceae bacterium]|nr:LysM peptidoglycan-binding domain-containing protein [Desulforegulaceae bacterium]
MGDNNRFDPRIEENYYGEESVSVKKSIKNLKEDDRMKKILKRADFPFFLLGGFVLILLIFILVKLPGENNLGSGSSIPKGDSVKELKQTLADIKSEVIEIRYNFSSSASSPKDELSSFLNEIDRKIDQRFFVIEKKIDDLKDLVEKNKTVLNIPSPKESSVKDKKPLSLKKDESSIKVENVKKVYHSVKKGDTLYGISRKYKVSVEEIKKINKMKNNSIQPGDKLLIKN